MSSSVRSVKNDLKIIEVWMVNLINEVLIRGLNKSEGEKESR